LRLARKVVAGKTKLTESEIRELTATFTNLYGPKPNVVRTPENNTIYVGDLHGDFQSAQAIRNLFIRSPDHSLVFLGDYADRGPHQVETFNLVMSMAIQYPERILMLRGNHESGKVARMYGFYDAVRAHYTVELFDAYCEVFKSLPLCGFSKHGVFSCHGGVPEGVDSIEQIQSVDRHSLELDNPIAYELAWNDPVDADSHFRPNRRGGGTKTFGRFAFDKFVKSMNIKLMVRAHEVFSAGCKRFFGGRLISVFSTTYSHRANPKIVCVGIDLVPEIIPI
jgi:protein phosphatase